MKVVESNNSQRGVLPWLLGAIVVTVCIVAWGVHLGWNARAISIFSLFPLLGLMAWALMWTHYAFGALKITFPDISGSNSYDTISKIAVLGLILLHPGLITWKQWDVTDTLPPGSVYNYVDSSLKIFVIFGVLALTIFLSFELFARIKTKPRVQKSWIYISLAQMLATTLIFAHSIALGGVLNQEWFLFFWVSLGALLIPCFALVGISDWSYTKSKKLTTAGGGQDE